MAGSYSLNLGSSHSWGSETWPAERRISWLSGWWSWSSGRPPRRQGWWGSHSSCCRWIFFQARGGQHQLKGQLSKIVFTLWGKDKVIHTMNGDPLILTNVLGWMMFFSADIRGSMAVLLLVSTYKVMYMFYMHSYLRIQQTNINLVSKKPISIPLT